VEATGNGWKIKHGRQVAVVADDRIEGWKRKQGRHEAI